MKLLQDDTAMLRDNTHIYIYTYIHRMKLLQDDNAMLRDNTHIYIYTYIHTQNEAASR